MINIVARKVKDGRNKKDAQDKSFKELDTYFVVYSRYTKICTTEILAKSEDDAVERIEEWEVNRGFKVGRFANDTGLNVVDAALQILPPKMKANKKAVAA